MLYIISIYNQLQWLSESARYYSYNGHNDKAIKVLEQVNIIIAKMILKCF